MVKNRFNHTDLIMTFILGILAGAALSLTIPHIKSNDFEGSELYEEIFNDIDRQTDILIDVYGDPTLTTARRIMRNNPIYVKMMFDIYKTKYC